MTTRIIFNGREYASTEAMPKAIRTAYQEALAKLEDANLYEYALRQAEGAEHGSKTVAGDSGTVARAQTTPSQAHRTEALLRALDTTEHTLARVLQILLGVAAGGVVAGGVWMISHMDASSRSQAGDIFVGIGMLMALACIAGMYISIEMRLKKK